MKIRLDRDDSCIHAIIRLAVLPSVSIIYVCILASIVAFFTLVRLVAITLLFASQPVGKRMTTIMCVECRSNNLFANQEAPGTS